MLSDMQPTLQGQRPVQQVCHGNSFLSRNVPLIFTLFVIFLVLLQDVVRRQTEVVEDAACCYYFRGELID